MPAVARRSTSLTASTRRAIIPGRSRSSRARSPGPTRTSPRSRRKRCRLSSSTRNWQTASSCHARLTLRVPRRFSSEARARHSDCWFEVSGRGEETSMNNDRIAGNWKQMKGKLKEQWGKLTDDEIDQLEGKSEQLAGKLQERYGMARDEA